MKFKKILLVIFSLFMWKTVLSANTLFPEVYGNFGFAYVHDSLDFKKSNSLSSNSEIMLALGVRPLSLPVLGGFRAELSYFNNFKKSESEKLYGTTVYYDFFRFLPLNPYLGSGFYRVKSKSSKNNYDYANNLVSLNAGLNASLPFNLDLFMEYRVMRDSYKSFFSSGREDQRQDIFLGIRYYFL